MNRVKAQDCLRAIENVLKGAGVRVERARIFNVNGTREGFREVGKGLTKREGTCELRWGIESGRVNQEDEIYGVSIEFAQTEDGEWEDCNLNATSLSSDCKGDRWDINVDAQTPETFRERAEGETEEQYFKEVILGEFIPYVARMYLRKREEGYEDAAETVTAVLQEIAGLPGSGTPVLPRRQPRRLS